MSRERDRRRILPFRQPLSRPARPDDPPAGERGRIILFTGVRYERMNDAAAAPVLLADTDSNAGDLRVGG